MAAARFSEADSRLIDQLVTLAKKSPKLVKSSEYETPADPSIKVRSWRMNEFKYYDIPSPFPTLARGLFTLDLPEGGHRIVVRGYDKFFNIGEVPWATWPSLEAHTAPPYTLTLKSNGCIIFIAALTPTKLLITSKHSLGAVGNAEVSHAQAGEAWLRKYFEQKGKTEEDLAQMLWENNWTAVAELCDDSFEEHVLAYSEEKTGLHLHGLNVATQTFTTMPQSQVDAFADQWGFIKTKSIVLKSISDVQSFTQRISEEGEWEGEAVEGFVVRTQVAQPPIETKRGSDISTSLSPYDPGTSFFFKVKFDEPYMMYRDWRELTKKMLTGKTESLPRNKMKRPETQVYVHWAREEIKRNKEAFESYNKGKGIIATRETFLAYLQTDTGKKELENARLGKKPGAVSEKQKYQDSTRTIIVPVAIPGCGKTTVSVALAHIFGFGHTQSDDIKQKKAAPAFIKNVNGLLKTHKVVIADKNNHLTQHRTQLREIAGNNRLVALNWSVHGKESTAHRVCGDRIYGRGNNHQSLLADTENKTHEDVVSMFIRDSQELAESEVDEIIDVNLEDDLETMVKYVTRELIRVLELPEPSPEKIQEGLEKAKAYKAKTDEQKAKRREKEFAPRFFALLPELNIKYTLNEQLKKRTDVPDSCRQLWEELQTSANKPMYHITIVHKASLPEENELWERCFDVHRLPKPPLFSFKLDHLVWNDRVMALAVKDLAVDTPDDGQQGHEFVSKLAPEIRERLHITLGTKNSAKPVEALSMVEGWREEGDKDKAGSIKLEDIVVKGLLKGLMG